MSADHSRKAQQSQAASDDDASVELSQRKRRLIYRESGLVLCSERSTLLLPGACSWVDNADRNLPNWCQ